jgi:hypothetical protein
MLKSTARNIIRISVITITLILGSVIKPLFAFGTIKELSDLSTDTVKVGQQKVRKHLMQFGPGVGYCFPGFNLDMNCTYISSNLIGGSVTLSANVIKSHDTPDDYFDDGHRSFAPKNYVYIISIDFYKAFLTQKKSFRFGFEIGPSLVNFRKAEFEKNENYDPEAPWGLWNDTYYLYHKSHSGNSTIGLSVAGKMDFLFKRHNGLEISIFTNINSLKSVAGLGLYFVFGKWKD